MGLLKTFARALVLWGQENALDLLSVVILPASRMAVAKTVGQPVSRWASENLWSIRTVDGAVLRGLPPAGSGAKFTLPKGLPAPGHKSLVIENEIHEVDGFDGIIPEGYGKGTKTLLIDDIVPVKIAGRTFLSRLNYHFHEADKAGPHYDLAIAGVPEGTQQFEFNIPRGDHKGRYAVVTTARGRICVPMSDSGVLLPKPEYKLKPEEFLSSLDPEKYVIERKIDGSLGNLEINSSFRAIGRSHRETGEPYFDKMPAVEFLDNRSPVWAFRTLMPGPDQRHSVFQGELAHRDGVGRTSGILNALPANAQATQKVHGPVEFYAWDIVKLRGKDVSFLPSDVRRKLLDEAVKDIRQFNKHWHVVDKMPEGMESLEFYRKVINDPRGLPWSEGIVVKPIDPGQTWLKIKRRDFEDFVVLDILPSSDGTKYANSLGKMVVQDPVSGGVGEVGSFAISDAQRQWIYDHRSDLIGAVAKVGVMEKTAAGAPRAGVFHSWHGDPRFGGMGSEMSLAMYSEALAGADPEESQRMLYRLKSSAGWRR